MCAWVPSVSTGSLSALAGTIGADASFALARLAAEPLFHRLEAWLCSRRPVPSRLFFRIYAAGRTFHRTIPVVPGRNITWSRFLALGCLVISMLTLQSFFFPPFPRSLATPCLAVASNTRDLFLPDCYAAEMRIQLDAARPAAELPHLRQKIGSQPVDIFGQDQAFLLFNDLITLRALYFKSYLAYNASLSLLNQTYYLSPSAPRFVLFNLSPLDRKFPPLEDQGLLMHLLCNYQFIAAESPFLLLEQRSLLAPQLTLLRELRAELGEPVFSL